MTNAIANDYLNRKTDWRFTAVISLLSLIIALPFAAFAEASAQTGAQDGKTDAAAPKIALEEREHNFGKVKEGEDVISNDTAQASLKLWLHTDVYKANSEGANNMSEKSVLEFTLKNIDGK